MVRSYAILIAILACTLAASLLVGTGDLGDAALTRTFLELRAVRFGAAFLAGAALAVGGVIVQALFRNPLADPAMLGTSAGAALGGKLSLLAFQAITGGAVSSFIAPEMLLPIGCLLGAFGALAVLMLVHRKGDDMIVLLLTGFILSSLLLSAGIFVSSLAAERWELARAMMDFSMGGVTGVSAQRVVLATPLILAGVGAAVAWSRSFDLLLSGEDEARALGVDVTDVRRSAVLWTCVLTAAAVSIGGGVGFVGLIVPHALRALVGFTHRRLVAASALGGGAFLVACDVLARAFPTRTEVPLGVITGLIGAPMFLVLLARSRREAMLGG